MAGTRLLALPGTAHGIGVPAMSRVIEQAVHQILRGRLAFMAQPPRHRRREAALGAIRDRLARFKQPKAAVVVDELPRNTMGKVQKNLLRDQYKGLFA